ncbi:MAG: class I SAM-dependent methyltransferase [Gemmatimonadota bacterium]
MPGTRGRPIFLSGRSVSAATRTCAAGRSKFGGGITSRRTRTEVSKPEPLPYAYKKGFYRNAEVASYYDDERFAGPFKQKRNLRKWRTIEKALDELGGTVQRVVDLPCGTGRFTGALAGRGLEVVGADISREMMAEAIGALGGLVRISGFVQADAERLPFRDDGLDCVISIRFMFHVDPLTRVTILRELGRVARFQVVDYRHRYSYRYARWRARQRLGLTTQRLERVSRDGLELEFRDAGLRVRRVLPVARVFSDKWIVIGERA